MGTISATGIGSGLDIQSIVKQIVDAERAPRERLLDSREAQAQMRLSSFGSLRSTLSQAQDSLMTLRFRSSFRELSASASNTGVLSASVTNQDSVSAGSYSVNVQSLAASHTVASASGAFADGDSLVGEGRLVIRMNGEDHEINMGPNSTLSDLRGAINGLAGLDARASIVNDGNGARLVLTAGATGVSNAIESITAFDAADEEITDGSGLGRLTFGTGHDQMIQTRAAADAVVLVDNIEITSSTNTFAEAIEGMSFTVSSVGESVVTVQTDTSSIRDALHDFVQHYNNFVSLSRELSHYDPAGNEHGPLLGDATLRIARNGLQGAIMGQASGGAFSSLIDIGVTFNNEGLMQINEAELGRALDGQLADVENLLAGSNGLATRLFGQVDRMVSSSGLFNAQNRSLQAELGRIAEQRTRLEERIERLETRYFQQFNRLDGLMARMQETSNYLSQQLANLPGARSRNS